MNNDLISREELKKTLENPSDKHYLSKSILDLVFKRIDNAPTVKAKTIADCIIAYGDGYETARRLYERPKGKWIQTEVIDDDSEYGVNDDASECSNCKHIENSHYWTTTYYNFCPNCGADMRKGDAK